jgi:hypothetical protein|tara:strand:- start:23 stop:205 length:183 start_codon:yes stop_codon:yes gene_type:complete
MTDQTKHGIEEIQSQNKAQVYQARKEMREELVQFIENCNSLELGELYSYMKKRKRGFNDE